MTARAFAGAAFALAFLTAARANAEPHKHDGFQFRGTLGLGYLEDFETTPNTPYSGRIGSFAGTTEFFFGGTLRPSIVIGGFLGLTSAPGPSATYPYQVGTLDLATFGPYVDYYFDPHQGFHVLGTVGLAGLLAERSDQSAASGFTVGAGVGYDWWIRREWSVGILARLQYARTTPSGPSNLGRREDTIAPTIAFSIVYQ